MGWKGLLPMTLVTVAACAAQPPATVRAQVLIIIDTDAPVPPSGEAPLREDPNRPPPLVSVARVEILERGSMQLACDTCKRDLALDEDKLRRHAVSFGIAAPSRPLDVRVRLFPVSRLLGGEPSVAITIDVRARLAATNSGGIVTQTIVARASSWGVESTPETAVPARVGPLLPSVVGTWEGARVLPCTVDPKPDTEHLDGERCIPGGVFLRSDPRQTFSSSSAGGPVREPRLVIVSPFLLDRDEYTVGRYLINGLPTKGPPPLTYDAADPVRKYCTLGDPRPDAHKLPLNCVTWDTADALCQENGGRLPTEVEREFAASGRGVDRLYPWGDDSPYNAPPTPTSEGRPTACCDAISFARYDVFRIVEGAQGSETDCSSSVHPPFGGARPLRLEPVDFDEIAHVGRCAVVRDRSRDGIRGLGGGLTEWTRDLWALSSDECWAGTTLLRDPVCTTPRTPPEANLHTLAGGNWTRSAWALGSRYRIAGKAGLVEVSAGLRCARDGVKK